ncbi:MAG: M1 family metallopeptidase, partial [Bacteroidota bacterium]
MSRFLFIFTLLFISISVFPAKDNFKTTHSDSLDILHYTINIEVLYTTTEIAGNTNLLITPKINNLDVISLDLLKLTIDSIWIDSLITANYTYNDTLLNIFPAGSFNLTDTFTVTVFYHGYPTEDPSGFGGFSFSGSYAYSIGVAFIDNPHNYGRVWYPCIDDFVDRATYDFYIKSDSIKFAVCNGTFQDVVYPGNSKAIYHWNMRDEIPTYLANVAVADYIAIRDTFVGILDVIPIAIYVRPTDSLKAVNSFINLKQILEGFEYRFGPYMWERVGLVAVPLGGGMEHATNISYGNSLITGNLTYEWLYAHEISHHWFGDLITCGEAEEMWINEGWAVYSEAIYMEYLYGRDAYRQYVRDNHKYVLRASHLDDGGYRALVGVPHEYTYGTTVYDKGGDVAHTIRGYMGDCTFFPAIKHLMDTFQFSDVISEDMKNVFTAYSGIDMTDFFNAWVYAPGFPHFSVDSFDVINNGVDYDVTVYIKQKLKG